MEWTCENCTYYKIDDNSNVTFCVHDGNQILNRKSCNEFRLSEQAESCCNCDNNWYDEVENRVCKHGHIGVENKCSQYKPLVIETVHNSDIDSFISITNEMKDIYVIKNKNYGNSFSEQFSEYGLTSVCIRLDDKIRRLKSINKQQSLGNVDVDDESIRDTLVDLANYAILAVIELDRK